MKSDSISLLGPSGPVQGLLYFILIGSDSPRPVSTVSPVISATVTISLQGHGYDIFYYLKPLIFVYRYDLLSDY
jgi:hypothetical protein